MEKRAFKKLVNEMIKGTGSQDGVIQYLKKETERLYNSGGIDPELYGNDYTLPRVCLYVALKNVADQYRPVSDNVLKDAKNLEHFNI